MTSEKSQNKNRLPREGISNVEYLPTVQWKDTVLPNWATPSDRFMLSQVCGDSLAAIGIYDGDFVLIHLTQDVLQGDLVGVSTPAGFLVKFLFFTATGDLCLRGANGAKPHIFPLTSTRIEGRVIRKEPS